MLPEKVSRKLPTTHLIRRMEMGIAKSPQTLVRWGMEAKIG